MDWSMTLYGANTIVLLSVPFMYKALRLSGEKYFGKYLEEKGKNLATKEDFGDLLKQQKETTRELESIKVTVSGEMWVAQERWKLKREIYTALLKALAELRIILSGFEWATREGEPPPSLDDPEKELLEMSRRSDALLEQIALDRAVAEVWLGADALKALEELDKEMGRGAVPAEPQARGEGWAHLKNIVEKARMLLVEAARKDFRLEAPSRK